MPLDFSLAGFSGTGPRRPTQAQLAKLVRAYAEYRAALRGAPPAIEQKMYARYQKALQPVLDRLQARFLSEENMDDLRQHAAEYARHHLIGPGVSW